MLVWLGHKICYAVQTLKTKKVQNELPSFFSFSPPVAFAASVVFISGTAGLEGAAGLAAAVGFAGVDANLQWIDYD